MQFTKQFKVFAQKTPLEDNFKSKSKNIKQISLTIKPCNNCGYVFLPQALSPKKVTDIIHNSINIRLKKHYQIYANEINKLQKGKKKLCVDR